MTRSKPSYLTSRWQILASVTVYLSFLCSCTRGVGLRGGRTDHFWRSSLIKNRTFAADNSPTIGSAPLICELDTFYHDGSQCDIIGLHPTTPICVYHSAPTEGYQTICMETDTDSLTATLHEPHPHSYCGPCRSCFETKEELQNAVHKYKSYKQVDMTLAIKYGWPIGQWCLRPSITDFSHLFFHHHHFNEDISMWSTSHVTTMEAMFQFGANFNQDISSWNVSRVTNMARMFAMAADFNQPLENWDVSGVTDMSYMFLHSLQFNQSLHAWNVDPHCDRSGMFRHATSFSYNESTLLQEWEETRNPRDPSLDPMCSWGTTGARMMQGMIDS